MEMLLFYSGGSVLGCIIVILSNRFILCKKTFWWVSILFVLIQVSIMLPVFFGHKLSDIVQVTILTLLSMTNSYVSLVAFIHGRDEDCGDQKTAVILIVIHFLSGMVIGTIIILTFGQGLNFNSY